jgi:membrane protease YdiL (CAAX protease family)
LRPAAAIAIYAVVVVALSALAAPWAFIVVHPHLPSVPFRRVFDRVLLVIALVGLWPLLRSIGLRSWRELGFPFARTWWRHVVVGYAIGAGSFIVAGALLIALGERSIDANPSVSGLILQILKFAATGIAVAVVEETFFRGGVQGALQRASGPISALVVTSVIYSGVHFLKPKGTGIAADAVTWSTGFDHLWRVVTLSARMPGVASGFVTLLLAGLALGWAFAKTRALYLSIGLHAGWVCTLKTYGALTAGGRMIENVAMWPVLIAVLLLLAWLCHTKLGSVADERSSPMAQTGR